jgi:hypothetical protein
MIKVDKKYEKNRDKGWAKMTGVAALVTLLILADGISPAMAPAYHITADELSGGGNVSSSASYTNQSSIGQAGIVGSVSSSANYQVTPGLWAAVAVSDGCSSYYDFQGFQQPINPDGSSIFKSNRTIPVKIILTDCDGNSIPDATVRFEVYMDTYDIRGTEEEDVAETLEGSDLLFRYDETDGQYIYNLSTKGYSPGIYTINAVVGNQKYPVQFSLR